MPNWCVNKLYVKGRAGDKAEFFRFISDRTPERDLATRLEGLEPTESFDFNDFIPYPASFTRQDALAGAARKRGDYSIKDGYNSGGYDWCIINWGTKWNANEVCRDSKNCLRFGTAWGPPLPVILAVALRFPSLTFTLKYFERGAAFQGTYTVKGADVLVDESGPYRGNLGG